MRDPATVLAQKNKTQRCNPADNPRLKLKAERILEADGITGILNQLTTKQGKFVEEYVKDYDCVEALYRAGFKPANRTNASKMAFTMLDHPLIKLAVRHYTELRADKATVDVKYVLDRIVRTVEKMEKLVDDAEGAKEASQAGGVLLRGAELLARHLNMFKETVELTGKDGGAIQMEEIREHADAFASSITRLATRAGEAGSPLETRH